MCKYKDIWWLVAITTKRYVNHENKIYLFLPFEKSKSREIRFLKEKQKKSDFLRSRFRVYRIPKRDYANFT